MPFILASASPARRAVLKAAGIEPVVVVSEVDEEAIAARMSAEHPTDVVCALAAAKAADVAGRVAGEHPDAVVIGCDSMLLVGGALVGKPGTEKVARRRWEQLAGSTADLLTGHAVVRLEGGRRVDSADGVECTTIRFATPTEAELDAYLASGEPLQVAGGFTLDGLGGWFIDGVDGDPSSVIGISLPLTRRLLDKIGITVTDLWRARST